MRLLAAHRFFHTVEKSFPLRGKIAEKFSIAWKNPAFFSTLWKNVFHSVENSNGAFHF